MMMVQLVNYGEIHHNILYGCDYAIPGEGVRRSTSPQRVIAQLVERFAHNGEVSVFESR